LNHEPRLKVHQILILALLLACCGVVVNSPPKHTTKAKPTASQTRMQLLTGVNPE
jgi:hypothetical protein